MTLIINNTDVSNLLKMGQCLEALEQAYVDLARGDLVNRPRIDLCATTQSAEKIFRWGTMEAVNARTGYHAIRMKSDMVYWVQHDFGITEEKYCMRPGAFCGLIFLFSARDGEPLAIIHDGYLTHMRVGAIAALGVKYLARADANTVGLLGSGWMARSHLSAFSCVRTLRRVKVFSPSVEHRRRFAREMTQLLGVEIETVDNPAEAVKGTDIVSTCTDSITPVLHGSSLEPGMHLTCVKAKGEWHNDVFAAIDVVAGGDSARPPLFGASFRRGQGNFLTFAAGSSERLDRIPRWGASESAWKPSVRLAPLAEMIKGELQGRRTEIEVSASGGSGAKGSDSSSTQGLPFVTLGALVYEMAKVQHLGREISTELLLQDIRD